MNGHAIESGIRRRLDDWRFWVGVSYAGVAFVVIALWWVNLTSDRADTELILSNCLEIEQMKSEIRDFVGGFEIDLGGAFSEQPCPRPK